MLRILLALLLMSTQAWCADQWDNTKPQSGDNPVNWPANEQTNNNAVDRLLFNYRKGQDIQYLSSSTITVTSGEINCNSATPRVMRQNTSNTTLTTSNLDTGSSFAVSTTYYIYAVADTNATTNTYLISLSSTAPSGATNYRLLGNFTTDTSSNILAGSIVNQSSTQRITSVLDYGTSTSAFTIKNSQVLISYGSGTDPFSITNLPFTSSSSYHVTCTIQVAGVVTQNVQITAKSASGFTCSDGLGNGNNIDWIAVGT